LKQIELPALKLAMYGGVPVTVVLVWLV